MNTFRNTVVDMTTEHVAANGSVNCEFSTTGADIDTKKEVLAEANTLPGYRWVIYTCETCRGHHEDRPVHVQIVNEAFWGADKVDSIEGLL